MTATAIRLEELESPAPNVAIVPAPEAERMRSLRAEMRTRLARPVELHSERGLAVELDVPGFYASAFWDAGRGCVRLPLAGIESTMPPLCREAIEMLLGLLAGAVVGVERGESDLALVSPAGGDADAPDIVESLATAFEALTVAARLGVAEAEAIAADETLACLYLAAVRAGKPTENRDRPAERTDPDQAATETDRRPSRRRRDDNKENDR